MDAIKATLGAIPNIKDFIDLHNEEELIRLRHRAKKSGKIALAQMLDAEIRKRGQ